MYIGLCLGTIGCAVLVVYGGRKIFLRKACGLYQLSSEVKKELEVVGNLPGPYPKETFSTQLPFRDLGSIYLNSRENRRRANDHRIQDANPDNAYVLEMLSEKHEKIKRIIVASCIERITDKLGLSMPAVSPRVLLWTYGEEQEMLSHLSQNCDPITRESLAERL